MTREDSHITGGTGVRRPVRGRAHRLLGTTATALRWGPGSVPVTAL